MSITGSGVRVIDEPCWTLTFSECENVKLTGLTIDTGLNFPNDVQNVDTGRWQIIRNLNPD